jgi:hypothetical protein
MTKATKKKAGRKPMPAAKRRDVYVPLRLTKAEHVQLKTAAGRIPLSLWARVAVMEKVDAALRKGGRS